VYRAILLIQRLKFYIRGAAKHDGTASHHIHSAVILTLAEAWRFWAHSLRKWLNERRVDS
jgi:hypothetical protein